MNFLENTLRDWKVMLDPMAAKKPPQLKVASEADAATTPPTIGTKDSSTGTDGESPRKMLERRTEKNGSIACSNQATALDQSFHFFQADNARWTNCRALHHKQFGNRLCACLMLYIPCNTLDQSFLPLSSTQCRLD